MAGGLAALFDDVVAIARAAAASLDDVAAATGKATAKAAGVVVDDAAVTPRYVQGITPQRELPVVWKIARGSIINKLVIILPLIMLMSEFTPWLLTPLLMVGGLFLCFEGAEKIWEVLTGHSETKNPPASFQGAAEEKQIVRGAVRTDLILSAEIMVISLSAVDEMGFWMRLISLIVVALVITVAVYGVVALIVKMDDVGLALAKKPSTEKLGTGIVKAMPVVMKTLSIVGVIAMLWVGGHILLVGMHDLGFHPIYDWVHDLEVAVAGATGGAGAALGWLTNTFFSAVLGFVLGSVVVGVVALAHTAMRGKGGAETDAGEVAEGQDGGQTSATGEGKGDESTPRITKQ